MTQEAKQEGEAEAAGRDVSLPWCLSRFPVDTTLGTFLCANSAPSQVQRGVLPQHVTFLLRN